MARTKRKPAKSVSSARKPSKGQTKLAEYVSCLWELNKLQRVLLTDLRKRFL